MRISARVAEELEKIEGTRVSRQKGGLGELSVTVDGAQVFDGNRFLYPRVRTVVEAVRSHLQRV